MFDNGFVKINRNILEWRWYKDQNTFRVFFHLLLKANFKDGEFEKHVIKRGQLVTGRKRLAQELNLSERQVRTALQHLISTNEIATKGYSKYSIITINNYDLYQSAIFSSTDKKPPHDYHTTGFRPQYNKDNKNNNEIYFKNRNASYTLEDFESKSLFTD